MSFALQHDAFRAALTDVRTAAGDLRHERERIDRKVTGFLGAGWVGAAADSFAEGWDDWRLAAGDVLEGLVAMGQLLEAAHADFVAQDVGSRQRLDEVASRITDRLG